jgi:hypothetical protein
MRLPPSLGSGCRPVRGAKGPRWYDWALTEAADPAVTEGGGPLDLLAPVDQSSIPGSTCGWSNGTG